ncbi:MAG: alpha/beta hydrolase [Deltaproteobacteria bacterium]|nr:alpha/beta hydrolase [Deltaproteobacteria bacterium]
MMIFKVFGIAFGALIGIILLYLIIVIFAPGFNVAKQPFPISESATKDRDNAPAELVESVSFEVGGLKISGWLYLPENIPFPVPCIIMNHGFGGTKDVALEPYALRFRDVGIAVLTYDYRYFGESEGEPRQLFSVASQLEDCSAAIDYARKLKEIDPEKIIIWGTSAGGGYGLVMAAKDRKIAGVIAQCSALDSQEDGKVILDREGIGFFLRLFMHAQRDKGRSRFGLSAHKIPIVGKSGSLAMLNAPGAFEGYAKLASADFINEVCARALLTSGGYNPIDHAKDVRCPVLIQICENDNLVSKNSAFNTAKILGEYAELKQYPIGHFDIYLGENFEKAVHDQIEFLRKIFS